MRDVTVSSNKFGLWKIKDISRSIDSQSQATLDEKTVPLNFRYEGVKSIT